MNVASAILMKYEPLRSIAFGGISGTYAGVGIPFDNSARMVEMWNMTDANLLISYNGVTDHNFIPANSGKVLDYAANKSLQGGVGEQQAGTRVYVKQEAGAATLGNVYLVVTYASGV